MFTTKDHSNAHEKRVATSYAGIKNPNSGAIPVAKLKGDVRTSRHMIECKCTSDRSLTVTLDYINKIKKEAWDDRKVWIIDGEIHGKNPDDVLTAVTVCDRDHYLEIYTGYEDNLAQKTACSAVTFIKAVINNLPEEVRGEVTHYLRTNVFGITRQEANDLIRLIK